MTIAPSTPSSTRTQNSPPGVSNGVDGHLPVASGHGSVPSEVVNCSGTVVACRRAAATPRSWQATPAALPRARHGGIGATLRS